MKNSVIPVVIFLAVVLLLICSSIPFLKNIKVHSTEYDIWELFRDKDKDGSHIDEEITKALVGSTSTHIEDVGSTSPQFVILSFDGSKSVSMWEETRRFANKLRAEGKPLSFTYFINGVYFLGEGNKDVYKGPTQATGTSGIGFAESEKSIAYRVEEVNAAIGDGHEIGSHTAGHFDGKYWTNDQWKEEFESFNKLIFHISENNPQLKLLDPLHLAFKDVVGFRAPELSVNKNTYAVLKEMSFIYDASGISKPAWPTKDEFGIWHVPLNAIPFGKTQMPVLTMDYSIWVHQSGAQNVAVKGTPLWDYFYNEILDAYMGYFNRSLAGNHEPIIIGHHFSKWNDGVYWEAMKAFAENVCGLPNVRCTTYKELIKYMEMH